MVVLSINDALEMFCCSQYLNCLTAGPLEIKRLADPYHRQSIYLVTFQDLLVEFGDIVGVQVAFSYFLANYASADLNMFVPIPLDKYKNFFF
jgi:hypothetical protein